MLTLINRQKIESIIREATNESDLYIAPLLEQWADAKKPLFELFGNSLTMQKTLDDTLTDNEIIQKINSFIYTNNNPDLKPVIDHLSKLYLEELKNNSVISDATAKGMKLSKYLGKLVLNPNNPITVNGKEYKQKEYFDIQFSILLQSIKVKSTLIISIDPIDYLTMSISGQNWQSCHNIEDGCHRAGTLSYMTDNHTAIAYTATKDFTWNGIPLSNKTWRQAVYIDTNNNSAIFSRQYPNVNEVTAKNTRKLIGNAISAKNNFPNTWKVNRDQDDIQEQINDNNDLHYNDILKYSGVECSMIYFDKDSLPDITLGNNPYCLCCGNLYITDSHELFCDNCSTGITCTCCDGRIDPDEVQYYDGEAYCQDCFNDNFSYCEECDSYEPSDNFTQTHNGDYVCNNCLYNNYTYCEECEEYYPSEDMQEGTNYTEYCPNCFDELYFECEECGDIFKRDIHKDGHDRYCEECQEILDAEEEAV